MIDLLDDPESHQLHVKRSVVSPRRRKELHSNDTHHPLYHRYSGSVTLRVIYGKTTPASLTEDPYLLHLKRMVPIVQGALLPGAYKVDHFPILQYVPWYGRQLKKWGEEEYEMLMSYMFQYKSQMVSRSFMP